MANVRLKQGEDKKISVLIKDGGVAVDMSACTEIRVKLSVDKVEQKRYSLTTQTEYGTLEVDDTVTNQINIFVEREESKDFPIGQLEIAVLGVFTDADFSDGNRTQEFSPFIVGRVLQGDTKDEVI